MKSSSGKFTSLCAALAVAATSLAPQVGYVAAAAAVVGATALTPQSAQAQPGQRICGKKYDWYWNGSHYMVAIFTKVANRLDCATYNSNASSSWQDLTDHAPKWMTDAGIVNPGAKVSSFAINGMSCENVSALIHYPKHDLCNDIPLSGGRMRVISAPWGYEHKLGWM